MGVTYQSHLSRTEQLQHNQFKPFTMNNASLIRQFKDTKCSTQKHSGTKRKKESYLVKQNICCLFDFNTHKTEEADANLSNNNDKEGRRVGKISPKMTLLPIISLLSLL